MVDVVINFALLELFVQRFFCWNLKEMTLEYFVGVTESPNLMDFGFYVGLTKSPERP